MMATKFSASASSEAHEPNMVQGEALLESSFAGRSSSVGIFLLSDRLVMRSSSDLPAEADFA
jgi:hypothetical protein